MGHTFYEKVIAKKVGHPVRPGESVVVNVDTMMATDATAPLAIKAFRDMGGRKIVKPESTVLILDHAVPCPNESIANLHKLIREFAVQQGNVFYDQNVGVCHQVMLENGHVQEGSIVLGADSHTCSYGAVGAFAIGVGSTDIAAAFLTGKTWLRVPKTVRIELTGRLSKGVLAKDVALHIIGGITCHGATGYGVEYGGEGFAAFSVDEAITICNMSIEMGAEAGVFVPALSKPDLIPDFDANYERIFDYDATKIMPMVSCPHAVDNVRPVNEVEGTRIEMAYLGSCTNARLSDIAIVAEILRGKKVSHGVRMIVCPASAEVLKCAVERGFITDLIEAGVILSAPGCGLCVGTLGGVPGDGEVVVSTTNRNSQGRMGNNKAFIYLASPATVAASALCGRIVDPREVLQ